MPKNGWSKRRKESLETNIRLVFILRPDYQATLEHQQEMSVLVIPTIDLHGSQRPWFASTAVVSRWTHRKAPGYGYALHPTALDPVHTVSTSAQAAEERHRARTQ